MEIQVDVAVVGIDRPATGPRQARSREQEGREARRQHEPPGESEGRPHSDSFSNAWRQYVRKIEAVVGKSVRDLGIGPSRGTRAPSQIPIRPVRSFLAISSSGICAAATGISGIAVATSGGIRLLRAIGAMRMLRTVS